MPEIYYVRFNHMLDGLAQALIATQDTRRLKSLLEENLKSDTRMSPEFRDAPIEIRTTIGTCYQADREGVIFNSMRKEYR